MALPVSQDFELGSNGTTISTANSGGTGETAFNAIGSGTGTTEQFSSTTSAHGSLSGKVQVGTTSAAAYLSWTSTALGTISAVSYGRLYFNISSLTMTGDAIVAFYTGSTFGGGIQLGGASSGKLNFQNTAFGQTNTFTTTISVSTWYRVEWTITPGASAAGRLTASLYLGDSTTALENQTSTTGVYGSTTSWNAVRFGWGSAGANHASQPALYFDDLQLNSTGRPGPAVSNATPSDTDASGLTSDAVASLIASSLSTDASNAAADSLGAVVARFTATDVSGTTADSTGSVAATVATTDASGTTADNGSVTAHVSSSDASNAAADGGQVVVFRSDTDASGVAADTSGALKLSATDASSAAAEASSIVARFSDTDASGTTADGGSAGSRVTDADSSTSAESSASPRVVAAETSTATDSSVTTRLPGTDASGTTADAGEKVKVLGSDASGATADSPKTIKLAAAETGTGTDSGFVSGGSTQVTDSDTGHGEDSGWTYISSSETGHGTDAGEKPGPVGTETAKGTDAELTKWVSDTETSKSSEAGIWSGPFFSSDPVGPALDAGETVTVRDTEFSIATDTYVPVIDVYTYEAQFMIAQPGGGFLLVHLHPNTLETRVILRVDHIDGYALKLAHEIARSRTVEFVSDWDHGEAEEHEENMVGVRVSLQHAVEVTAELVM